MDIVIKKGATAHFHLPGLFEFYEFYKVFLPVFFSQRDWFYDFCDISSIYGAPADCIWGGGRVGFGDNNPKEVAALMAEYDISARLTFSNSLLTEQHLSDRRCNELCRLFDEGKTGKNGVIVTSDLLMDYIRDKYQGFYFVSSTTKVITDFDELIAELSRPEFNYVVPDFRFNNDWEKLMRIPDGLRKKMEFLCNECCDIACYDRKNCYENVSRKALGEDCADHLCCAPYGNQGYLFSKAMDSPAFIGIDDIKNKYLPKGFSEFKIEGRSLGSALLLEFILHFLTKPEHQIRVREKIYLDAMLDLF